MQLEPIRLEKIVFLRPDMGRLAILALIVTPEAADELTAMAISAAAPDGEDLMILRARGDELLPINVAIRQASADRLMTDAYARRVL